MAVKRISKIEQHVEKIALAVTAAGLLAVVGWQLVAGRTTVKVGQKSDIPIQQAYDEVAREAERVKASIEAEAPTLPEIPPESTLAEFRERFRGPVAPAPALAWNGERPQTVRAGDAPALADNAGVAPVQLPAPERAIANVYMATLDPEEVKATPELAALVPSAAPFDKASVSVQARIDGNAIRAALERDPDGDGPLAAVPRTWWEPITEIVAVEALRQERTPTGWSEPTLVRRMPGRLDLTEQFSTAVAVADIAALAEEARRYADELQRPEFYRILLGEEWIPPADAADLAAAEGEISDVAVMQREERQLTRQIERLQKAITDKGTAVDSRTTGGEDVTIGHGTSEDRRTREGERETQQVSPTRQLELRLERAKARLAQVQNDLRRAGVQVAGGTGQVAPPQPPRQPGDRAGARLVGAGPVELWIHDVTAERGKEYRYALRYVVPNPFFGRAAALAGDQARLAEGAVMASAQSEWSEPVRVFEQTYFFVTAATPRQPGTAASTVGRTAQANGEVFVFANGFWRKASITLEPGDPVIADVPIPDMEAIAAVRRRQERPRDPHAEPEPEPGSEEVQVVEDPDPSATGASAARPGRPLVKKQTVAGKAFLLDVATLPATRGSSSTGGGARSLAAAVFRDDAGTVTARLPMSAPAATPEEVRVRREYARLQESFRKGQLAAAPREPRDAGGERPVREPRPPAEPPPPRESGGGGGGGGGG